MSVGLISALSVTSCPQAIRKGSSYTGQGILLNVMWQLGQEGGLEENGNVYICMAESLCCSLETIAALLMDYIPNRSRRY